MTTATIGEIQVAFADDFFSSANDMTAADTQRVFKAVDQFRHDPDARGLRLKPLHGIDSSGRLHAIRASEAIRILIAREGNVFTFLEAGPRASIYERAKRYRFITNPSTGYLGFVKKPSPKEGGLPTVRTPATPQEDRPGILDHWADADLAEAGIGADEIARLRTCTSEDQLFDLGLDEETFSLVCDLIELTPEQWRTPSLAPEQDAEERFRRAILQHGAFHGFSTLFTTDELEKIAAAPIEDWMIFLHPEQRAVVDRRFNGPARIRGAAGTGKTVVALHRAAGLAKRLRAEEPGQKVLFTTFIKSLPPVLERLYLRLPGTKPGEVDFVHIDKLASEICKQDGVRPSTSKKDIDAAFAAAWRQAVAPGSPLAELGVTRGYIREEISAVIKGRGIATLDDYLAIERTGRRTRFPAPARRQVWDLLHAWYQHMTKRRTVDFPDVVLLARDHARKRSNPTYRAALIDEAQDLTLVGLQLVRALVQRPGLDRQDELLIVGDGAQRIYAGGFTLRQSGIDVRGRTVVLRNNYRNTHEILEAALAVAGDQRVEDLDESFHRAEETAETERAGGRPALVRCDDHHNELAFIGQEIPRLCDDESIGLGDIGVFVGTNHGVGTVRKHLDGMGIPSRGLDKYDGTPTPEVKVGTWFRAKGLEFKVVFLPGLGEGRFPRPPHQGQDANEYAEQTQLAISQLFVAMTRARDGLYVLASGNASPVLEKALDHFEIIKT